jgi:hypothetical protein
MYVCVYVCMCMYMYIKLMKQRFFLSQTIRQSDISAILVSSVIKTPSVKMLYPQKENLHFRKKESA